MIAAPDAVRRKDQLVPDNRVVNRRAFLDCRGRADQLSFQHTDPVILQIVHKVYPVTLISLRSPCGTLLRILVVDRPGESRIDNRVWINNPIGIPETSRQQVRRDAPRNDSAIVSPKIPGLLRPVQMRRLVQVAGIDRLRNPGQAARLRRRDVLSRPAPSRHCQDPWPSEPCLRGHPSRRSGPHR